MNDHMLLARRISLLLTLAVSIACGVSQGTEGLQGPEGPPGPAGPVGPSGPPGTNGSGLLEVLECAGGRTIGNVITFFEYDRYKFADGSILVACDIRDTASLYSNVALFRAGDPGAVKATCFLVYDLDAPSGGYWNFDSIGSNVSAVYEDSSSPSTGARIPLLCNLR